MHSIFRSHKTVVGVTFSAAALIALLAEVPSPTQCRWLHRQFRITETAVAAKKESIHMFGIELRSDAGFLPWLAQQITAPLVPFMWALLTASIPPALGRFAGTYTGQPLEIGIEFGWSCGLGWGLALALAIAVRRVFPSASRSGRWVWVLPVLLCTAGFIWDCTLFGFPRAVSEFFYFGPAGEAALGFALITFPTCSCIVYSLAMYLAEKKARKHSREIGLHPAHTR